jgi:DNA-dependent RNA polymerase
MQSSNSPSSIDTYAAKLGGSVYDQVGSEAVGAQVKREQEARQAVLGKRAADLKAGRSGVVLKRWVNGSIVPVAERLRQFAELYLEGELDEAAKLVDSPLLELQAREKPLRPLLEWALKGSSPGRAPKGETSHAEDLVLAFMGTAISAIVKDKGSISLNTVMASSSETLRETVQGQFIVSVQGAGAMAKFKERNPKVWSQKKSLKRIAAQLQSQVKPQLLRETDEQAAVRGRRVLHVIDREGRQRRLQLKRKPEALDWEILTLAWPLDDDNAAAHPQRSLWLGLAGLILACAQKEAGWFEVTSGPKKDGRRKRAHKAPKHLCLSEQAEKNIRDDCDRWLQSGYTAHPMLVPPEDGDYLTVKHRKVTGKRPARGMWTDPKDTDAWAAACVLAESPWMVNPYALQHHRDNPEIIGDDINDMMRLAEHRRLARETFYLPVALDFRGRIYYQPSWVTPQAGDLGKSMLMFPPSGREDYAELVPPGQLSRYEWMVMHMAGIYSGPQKVDKAPMPVRSSWWMGVAATWEGLPDADKPLCFHAHNRLFATGQMDSIPIQLDGTCNGLQHLSALLRDEEAAENVNLWASTYEQRPKDIYGKVAEVAELAMDPEAHCVRAHDRCEECGGDCPYCDQAIREPWVYRMKEAGILINRSLCKSPVMVLPYGGTREAVRLSVKRVVLEQMDKSPEREKLHAIWKEMLPEPDGKGGTRDYTAFQDRELHDHPGFNMDIQCLSSLIWDSIAPVIPKPMEMMNALAEIGSWVGNKALAWQTGVRDGKPLWVMQAKSAASIKRVQMKGFHLPNMIRQLALLSGTNDVDPKSHRTGIVANFIHSQDAAHLALTVLDFKAKGGTCVGAVHDCLLVRPSEAQLMGECLREQFIRLYENDPLSMPVKTIDVDTGEVVEYASWYEVAVEAGVELPQRGDFDITEVRHSAWFFS